MAKMEGRSEVLTGGMASSRHDKERIRKEQLHGVVKVGTWLRALPPSFGRMRTGVGAEG
ncbi:hypothetical protein [Oryza sativa Japonica Group]|uniref:Uncharacterized protein n=2 Tax=Oryza sativa subsp. japonica TaxID=39947 RepID=Q5JKK5_ORYSJ|nr:hypothetical protein [Oryza sativa Japonica Group]BAD88006.1 hypothetical protein [Oryza sativa Japonica Group]